MNEAVGSLDIKLIGEVDWRISRKAEFSLTPILISRPSLNHWDYLRCKPTTFIIFQGLLMEETRDAPNNLHSCEWCFKIEDL